MSDPLTPERLAEIERAAAVREREVTLRGVTPDDTLSLYITLRATRSERDEAIELLLDTTLQGCDIGGGVIDSGYLSSYADALRFLATHGLVEIQHEAGRRVIARLVQEEAAP